MSATPPNFPYMVSATPTASATPLKKRRGCGCFTSVTGAILPVFVVYVVRKPVMFYFRSPRDAQPKLNFELLGSWQGQQLVLEDRGSMAMSFAPDGSAKGYLKGANSRKESTTATLHYATDSEFSSACSTKNGNSF
jgi:hypothetical protein